VHRQLTAQGYTNLLTRSRTELDLTSQPAVEAFFAETKPTHVIMCAAKVGGIVANKTQPGDFIRENLEIQTHTITSAWQHGIKKFLFLGSSCIYPANAPQPIKEESLLTGPLEPTNDAYAIAKISGIMLGRSLRRQYGWDFISAQPTNLYGPGDNFHPEHSHVIPGLMARMHTAKINNDPTFSIWGTGKPMREFLYSEDCAEALVTMMHHYSEDQILNVGTGEDLTIAQLATHLAEVIGYTGELAFDPSKPDGMMRKVLDVSRLKALGWQPRTPLQTGLRQMYAWYLANH
jgi:GDP-L-fucose synthase